jgi:hypothetical protein
MVTGVDLAKSVFEMKGAATDGSVTFWRKLSPPPFNGSAAGRDWTECPLESLSWPAY